MQMVLQFEWVHVCARLKNNVMTLKMSQSAAFVSADTIGLSQKLRTAFTQMDNDMNAITTIVVEPTDHDILFGKDDFSIRHAGNVSLRTLIAFCHQEYTSLPNRWSKHQFLESIVYLILKSGGRFLQRDVTGEWQEATIEQGRQKVGQLLRDEARHPQIVSNHSLADTPGVIEGKFWSAYDFDWDGIVEACKQELMEPDLHLDHMLLELNLDEDQLLQAILSE